MDSIPLKEMRDVISKNPIMACTREGGLFACSREDQLSWKGYSYPNEHIRGYDKGQPFDPEHANPLHKKERRWKRTRYRGGLKHKYIT